MNRNFRQFSLETGIILRHIFITFFKLRMKDRKFKVGGEKMENTGEKGKNAEWSLGTL